MKPIPPDPVKLFFGILFTDRDLLEKGLKRLEKKFGPRDYTSGDFPFEETDYYTEEMGKPIVRRFIGFSRLISPAQLAGIKVFSIRLEEKLAVNGNRRINLDPGYMDYDKVVLASAKYNGQKIYLDQGIWADLTLHYEKGKFIPYPWSFPDFKKGLYMDVFLELRNRYKHRRRRSD